MKNNQGLMSEDREKRVKPNVVRASTGKSWPVQLLYCLR